MSTKKIDFHGLSEDFQVTSDNDYFQNLSYSVQSPITWDKFVDPLNRVVHPLGLKNFADTAITTNVNVGVSYGATTNDVVILDVYGEKRVDTINTFDEVLDYDIREGKSKYLHSRPRWCRESGLPFTKLTWA